jgi:hypothetical protein
MNYIPYDIELIIYRYVHEMYMNDIRKEINNINQNEISIINFLKQRVLYPYIFWNRLIKIKTNAHYRTIIDRYVHKKRMFRIFMEINKI